MTRFEGFSAETLALLRELADPERNATGWLDANRERYERAWVAPSLAFVEAMAGPLNAIDPQLQAIPGLRGGSLMRIQRDTRFSKDKRPYKDHLDVMFRVGEGASKGRPGLGFRLTASSLGLGGGLLGFEPDVLQRYREAVLEEASGAALADAVTSAEAEGAQLFGEQLKRVPRGLPAEHPRERLLRFKALWIGWEEPLPAELGSAALVDFVTGRLRIVWPVVRWLVPVVEGR